MVDFRKHIDTEIKSKAVPMLRAAGFRGSFPHFRRPSPRGIDLITFQFDRHGGGFVVEIACAPASGITTHWGKFIEPTKITAWDIHPNERWRLGSTLGGDFWFRYDDGNVVSCVSKFMELWSSAELWWSQHAVA